MQSITLGAELPISYMVPYHLNVLRHIKDGRDQTRKADKEMLQCGYSPPAPEIDNKAYTVPISHERFKELTLAREHYSNASGRRTVAWIQEEDRFIQAIRTQTSLRDSSTPLLTEQDA